MRRGEREMIRDAIAEAVREYGVDPSEARRHVLQGMRYVAGLLGMPEGHASYVWPDEEHLDRVTRRRLLLRYRRGA